MPLAVSLLGRYDVWDHADPLVLPFQSGMHSLNTHPEEMLWEELFKGKKLLFSRMLDRGATVSAYKELDDTGYCEEAAFETELDGLRVIAVNRARANSQLFKSVYDPDLHDAMIAFHRTPHTWSIVLYTDQDSVDVSKIAKARGGGGHRKAAGFQCAELPFKLP